MKIEVVYFRDLTPEQRQTWSVLCERSSAPCDSPFYRPEFAEVIDRARGDVEVVLVEDAGGIIALLPFHRLRGNVGKPVGLHLNDFQGFIGTLPAGVQAQELIRKAGLRAWDFDHVPVEQDGFASSVGLTDASPFIDLTRGYEAYVQIREAKAKHLKDSVRRRRKLERDHGEVRFEHGTGNPRVLSQLLDWKREQFARTSVPDVLAEKWVQAAVDSIADHQSPKFAGCTSALWAGDRLIAAEMGPRTAKVYHLQWCAYDPHFQAYSPGRLLNESMTQWAASNGIARVEFGKGDQDYKLRAATGQHLVGTGSVAAGAMQRVMRGTWWTLRSWARSSPLRPHLKAAASYYHRLRRTAPLLAREGT